VDKYGACIDVIIKVFISYLGLVNQSNEMVLRWISFFVAILVGVAIGLYYGWVINPVQYVDTTPASLHEEFKTDYVWMVAEAYQIEHNADLAGQRLRNLSGISPLDTVREALLSATQAQYRDIDLQHIRDLESAMRVYTSKMGITPQASETP
jgi:hypothetical protein